MSYDFYTEFWDNEKINSFIREYMEDVWNKIWGESSIQFKNKEKKFQDKIIPNLINKLYYELVEVSWENSTVTYANFLKGIELYFEKHLEEWNKWAEERLNKSYRGGNYSPSLPGGIVKDTYRENLKEYKISQDLISSFNFCSLKNKREPLFSILISITFTLKRPYLSRDDEEFYVIDNPVCKDKVFKVPYIRPSSWKGKLRWVACKRFLDKFLENNSSINWKKERAKIVRLFGNEKNNVTEWLNRTISSKLKRKEKEIEKEFEGYLKEKYNIFEGNRRGRLQFYPTFLNQIGLDIIAPHDRKTKTVTNPINLETSPEGAEGNFSLLYFPFDLIGKDEQEVKEQKAKDIRTLAKAIPAMLTKYGIGAKTTAGYGVAHDSFDFEIFHKKEEKEGISGSGKKDFKKKLKEIIDNE